MLASVDECAPIESCQPPFIKDASAADPPCGPPVSGTADSNGACGDHSHEAPVGGRRRLDNAGVVVTDIIAAHVPPILSSSRLRWHIASSRKHATLPPVAP